VRAGVLEREKRRVEAGKAVRIGHRSSLAERRDSPGAMSLRDERHLLTLLASNVRSTA
jgi:hypothetical protein